MKPIQLLLLATALIGLTSCGDDPFATTVELDLPDHEPLPVLTLDARAGDTALYSRVALSRGILEDPMPTSATPRVSFYRDGQVVVSREIELTDTDGDNFEYRLPDPIGPAESTYRVEVDFPGFDQIFAEQTMPAQPIVTDIDYQPDGALDLEGFRVDEINFTLRDDPATEDYYGFNAWVVVRDTFLNNCTRLPDQTIVCDTFISDSRNFSFVQSADPTIRPGEHFGLVVSDAAFGSSNFRVRMTADNYSEGELVLEVYHLTEDAYRYSLSQYAYLEADGNPFAEPISVHNNVEKGYGYFILSNKIEIPLE